MFSNQLLYDNSNLYLFFSICSVNYYQIVFKLQESAKFARHGKRKALSTVDFDQALKVKNIEVC